MFNQLKNIDTVARLNRNSNQVLMIVTGFVLCFGIYKSYDFAQKAQNRVHILYDGKVIQTILSDRKHSLPVELRDHIQTFHQYFFDLVPDINQITASVNKALYLADESAKRQYDNLREKGYYANLVSGNINQKIMKVDSIVLDLKQEPFGFTYYARELLSRSTSQKPRILITQGHIRQLDMETDNNPHGFLIEDWRVVRNEDITDSLKTNP